MEITKDYLKKFKKGKGNKVYALVEEICEYFGVEVDEHKGFLFGIYGRVKEQKMRQKLSEVKEQGIKDIRYYGACFKKKKL